MNRFFCHKLLFDQNLFDDFRNLAGFAADFERNFPTIATKDKPGIGFGELESRWADGNKFQNRSPIGEADQQMITA
jgi:hypothetical protein